MKDLVKVIAMALVNKQDEVNVSEVTENGETIITLHVADEDMGKVIGKQGRIAKSIRNVVKAASIREGKKVIVEIR